MTTTFTFVPTPLKGLFIVESSIFRDTRGFFLESYHQRKFAELGFTAEFVQDNHSRSAAGVVRGLHFQDMTAPMAKLIRCTRGMIFDVAVDLRLGSPTFGRWYGVELSEDNVKQLFVPVGFGHGFAVLSDWADVQYKCTNFYVPASEGCVQWNEPEIGVAWPVQNPIVSQRDHNGVSLRQYLERPAFRYPAA